MYKYRVSLIHIYIYIYLSMLSLLGSVFSDTCFSFILLKSFSYFTCNCFILFVFLTWKVGSHFVHVCLRPNLNLLKSCSGMRIFFLSFFSFFVFSYLLFFQFIIVFPFFSSFIFLLFFPFTITFLPSLYFP